MHLMNLPDEVLEKVLSFVSFDEVSRSRLVCRRFNEISKEVLNRAFHAVENYHSQCKKNFRSILPRRESERMNHPLARQCDVLTSVEAKLRLLAITFKPFMYVNLCCFIPGKVIDEIYRVMGYVKSEPSLIRANEAMLELRDISSMAIEHFDEKIAPLLIKLRESKQKIGQNVGSSTKHSKPNVRKQRNLPEESKVLGMAQHLKKLAKKCNKLDSDVAALRNKKRDGDANSKRLAKLERFVTETKKKLTEGGKKIAEQQTTITNQGLQINKLKLHKCFAEKPMIVCNLEYGSSGSLSTVKHLINEENYAVCEIKIQPLKSAKRKLRSNLEAEEMAKKKLKK